MTMNRYQVSCETKRPEALGNGQAWGVNSKTVEGATTEQATAEAILQLRAEVRGVVNVLKIGPRFYGNHPLSREVKS